jgi:hypothetical protein
VRITPIRAALPAGDTPPSKACTPALCRGTGPVPPTANVPKWTINTGKVAEDGGDPIGGGDSNTVEPPGLPSDPLDRPNLTYDFGGSTH